MAKKNASPNKPTGKRAQRFAFTAPGAMSVQLVGDFTHWQQPWRVVIPEPRDKGTLEFYSVGGTIARGGLLIRGRETRLSQRAAGGDALIAKAIMGFFM